MTTGWRAKGSGAVGVLNVGRAAVSTGAKSERTALMVSVEGRVTGRQSSTCDEYRGE